MEGNRAEPHTQVLLESRPWSVAARTGSSSLVLASQAFPLLWKKPPSWIKRDLQDVLLIIKREKKSKVQDRVWSRLHFV